jgi:hypothetical protein
MAQLTLTESALIQAISSPTPATTHHRGSKPRKTAA